MWAGLTGVGRWAGVTGGELGGDGFAEDYGAGGFCPRHGGGVGFGLVVGPDGGAVLAGHVGGVEDVLDADGDALEGAFLRRCRGRARLGGVEVGEGADGGVSGGDVVEVGFG